MEQREHPEHARSGRTRGAEAPLLHDIIAEAEGVFDVGDRLAGLTGREGVEQFAFVLPDAAVGIFALREMHKAVVEFEDAHEIQHSLGDLAWLQHGGFGQVAPSAAAAHPP